MLLGVLKKNGMPTGKNFSEVFLLPWGTWTAMGSQKSSQARGLAGVRRCEFLTGMERSKARFLRLGKLFAGVFLCPSGTWTGTGWQRSSLALGLAGVRRCEFLTGMERFFVNNSFFPKRTGWESWLRGSHNHWYDFAITAAGMGLKAGPVDEFNFASYV